MAENDCADWLDFSALFEDLLKFSKTEVTRERWMMAWPIAADDVRLRNGGLHYLQP
jgi:hypothetical protein